jgi:hypothetical protein
LIRIKKEFRTKILSEPAYSTMTVIKISCLVVKTNFFGYPTQEIDSKSPPVTWKSGAAADDESHYCDDYDHCYATTQYTPSSEHVTLGAVFSIGHATINC